VDHSIEGGVLLGIFFRMSGEPRALLLLTPESLPLTLAPSYLETLCYQITTKDASSSILKGQKQQRS
jgi:hypothetical protein